MCRSLLTTSVCAPGKYSRLLPHLESALHRQNLLERLRGPFGEQSLDVIGRQIEGFERQPGGVDGEHFFDDLLLESSNLFTQEESVMTVEHEPENLDECADTPRAHDLNGKGNQRRRKPGGEQRRSKGGLVNLPRQVGILGRAYRFTLQCLGGGRGGAFSRGEFLTAQPRAVETVVCLGIRVIYPCRLKRGDVISVEELAGFIKSRHLTTVNLEELLELGVVSVLRKQRRGAWWECEIRQGVVELGLLDVAAGERGGDGGDDLGLIRK